MNINLENIRTVRTAGKPQFPGDTSSKRKVIALWQIVVGGTAMAHGPVFEDALPGETERTIQDMKGAYENIPGNAGRVSHEIIVL